jgi:hypothetical protein
LAALVAATLRSQVPIFARLPFCTHLQIGSQDFLVWRRGCHGRVAFELALKKLCDSLVQNLLHAKSEKSMLDLFDLV